MVLDLHRPYPGVALVVAPEGSVLFGVPADAFKATKKYCMDHDLPFPRELVAPQDLLIGATPQFNPEFFLYDFLFVYGAAFQPDLQDARLRLLLDHDQVGGALQALRTTLIGPTREELESYVDAHGRRLVAADHVAMLASVGEHMAIKKGDRPRPVEDMVETIEFDRQGSVPALGGALRVTRDGPRRFSVARGRERIEVDLYFEGRVQPFATLPVPAAAQVPLTFGVKPLGTRSGFDLSGPTTGFLLWVNGRGVIYDGPVGTCYLLESQGIAPSDIDVVILSHCHEDHMGAFVELILQGYKPKVLTAEPIYRSALQKMSSYFCRPADEVAKLIDYQRVEPGVPVQILGAQFEFFYTVHAIATIGVAVSMRDRKGTTHRVQISGDTMHHEGLEQMKAYGVLTSEQYLRMRHLVPPKPVDDAHYFADVGEAIIHGHPRDWAENPNHLIYYHCPDNPHTRAFGKELAIPGSLLPLIEPHRMHPATPGRLLRALRFLDLNDPNWFQEILFQGRTRLVEAGEQLAQAGTGTRENDVFSVIVSGSADVVGEGRTLARLVPGEFFGVIELVDGRGRSTADVVAATPMELFEIDGPVFYSYIERSGMQQVIAEIWQNRPLVERARVFRRLDIAARNQIARLGVRKHIAKGEVIIKEGSRSDEFYILLHGAVRVTIGGKKVATITAEQDDNFFGELAALEPARVRSAEVEAVKDVEVLRLKGSALRQLFEDHMGIRYTLQLAVERRGGKP